MKKTILMALCAMCILFVGCSKDAKDVSIDELFSAAKDKMDTTKMADETDPDILKVFLEDLKDDDYSEFRYAMPQKNVFVSQIMIIKSRPDKLDNVKKCVETHVQNNKDIFKTYEVEQYKFLEKAELFTIQDYVVLLIGDGASEAKSAISKLF